MNIIDKKNKMKTALLLIPFLAFGIFIFLKQFVFCITAKFPSCFFRDTFQIYCPACGNTRSVLALLRGDLLTSLRYNITPMILLCLLGGFYLEAVNYYILKNYKKILPRNQIFWFSFLFLILLYYIIRNFIPYLIQ